MTRRHEDLVGHDLLDIVYLLDSAFDTRFLDRLVGNLVEGLAPAASGSQDLDNHPSCSSTTISGSITISDFTELATRLYFWAD